MARFDSILSWLGRWFNVLPLSDAAARLKRGTLPSRPLCITFDDGYADNFTNALPILQRHGMTATFFVASGFLNGGIMWNDTIIESIRRTGTSMLDLRAIGLGTIQTKSENEKRSAIDQIIRSLKHRPMNERSRLSRAIAEIADVQLPEDLMLTSDQLRGLRRAGMEIGAHTAHHPILARLDADDARTEIVSGRQTLESLLGESVSLFAYPNGKFPSDYTLEHAALAADLGFDAAVTTVPGASRQGDDVFQLRRFTPWDQGRMRFGLRLLKNIVAP